MGILRLRNLLAQGIQRAIQTPDVQDAISYDGISIHGVTGSELPQLPARSGIDGIDVMIAAAKVHNVVHNDW